MRKESFGFGWVFVMQLCNHMFQVTNFELHHSTGFSRCVSLLKGNLVG